MARRSDDRARAEALLHHVVAQIARETETSTKRRSAREDELRRAKRRLSGIKLGILLPLVFGLTLLNVASGGVPDTLRIGSDEGDQRARRNALSFTVDEVELYREENGELPRELDGLDIPEFGEWIYQRRADGSYSVELIDGGTSIRFDSRVDADTLGVTLGAKR